MIFFLFMELIFFYFFILLLLELNDMFLNIVVEYWGEEFLFEYSWICVFLFSLVLLFVKVNIKCMCKYVFDI